MTSNPRDPAVEAAQSAFLEQWPEQGLFEFRYSIEGQFGVAAAREALAPIRELHRAEVIKVVGCNEDCDVHPDQDCPCDVDFRVCWECYRFAKDEIDPYFGEDTVAPVAWPCATARLVYTDDELTGGES